MSRVVALLRGVNLAGKRKVSMPELRAHLEGLGYDEVSTYLATGNVLLTSERGPAELERELTAQVSAWAEAEVDVLVRTAADLGGVLGRDPFGPLVDDPSRYAVTFLSRRPEPEIVRGLESADFGAERVAVDGREIYSWHPEGLGRSKLAAALTAKRLGVIPTMRNWRTVTKLRELLG